MLSKEQESRPFLTIGVTTYNRHALLRETLQSILAQSFTDFEVIVGNDYTQEVLTGEMLGISDARIRFVNHPQNLREVGNMNALLAMARGRYFTWLFDDDLYQPDFLSTAHALLVQEAFPPALFPGHSILRGGAPYRPAKVTVGRISRLSGRDFLKNYFAGRLKVISTSGLFDTAVIRETTGGVSELCGSAIGLYCEYLFLVQCALLERIVCIDAPFVVFRAHPESWGESNAELHKYYQGGERLLQRCAEVLRQPALAQDFARNLLGVCRIHLATFCFAATRAELAAGSGLAAFWRALRRVTGEVARMRSIVAAGNGSGRAGAPFSWLGILGKCIYLMLFSFAYQGWRQRTVQKNLLLEKS